MACTSASARALGPARRAGRRARYNQLAREHGLTPTQLALAFCYRPGVASTIIGVTSLAQLDENLDAWSVPLSPELLAAVDGSGSTRATRRSDPMGKAKTAHVSETPATAVLRQHGVAFTEHPYDYVEHGGARTAPRCWGSILSAWSRPW
jgi:hypothetical protein